MYPHDATQREEDRQAVADWILNGPEGATVSVTFEDDRAAEALRQEHAARLEAGEYLVPEGGARG